MNTTDTFTLAGIYRPRQHGPGFGIPVFLHDGQYWVQDISSEDHVRQFVTCDVEAQTLHLPPLPADSTMHSVGKQALYAFEAADGTIKLGTRKEVVSLDSVDEHEQARSEDARYTLLMHDRV